MYRNATVMAVIILLTGTFIVGCQSGSSPGPVLPGLGNNGITENVDRETTSNTNSHMMWGMWHVVIDPVTLEPEITPLRGIQWHANVVEFLDPPRYHNLILKVDLDETDDLNGYFVVYVTLVHPFPGLNMYRGFDVRGAFLSNGTYFSSYDNTAVFPDPNPGANESRLLNPDGFMRWFNPGEFSFGAFRLFEYIPTALGTDQTTTNTLNPYKYYSDDFDTAAKEDMMLQDVDIDVLNRGQFSPGAAITRRYEIQFEMNGSVPVFEFSYVVDASYFDPIPDDPNFPIDSFSISANMQEVYKVLTIDNESSAFYVDDTTFGGDLKFDLELFDWQAPLSPSGVLDEIGSVIAESPTLFGNYTDGMVDVTDQFNLNAVWSTGTSSVATIEITNVTPTSLVDQYVFFTITSADPADYSNPFDIPYPTDPALAAYYLWLAPVSDYVPPVVDPITGEITVDETSTAEIYTCTVQNWSPSYTYTYMWSIESDGGGPNYVIDTGVNNILIVDWCQYLPGEYDMQCRVSDGTGSGESPVLDITRGLSTCGGGAHTYNSDTPLWPRFSYVPPRHPIYIVPDDYPQGYNYLPRFDMDFFKGGAFDGQGVMQAGNAVLMNFETSTNALNDPANLTEWRIPGMTFWDMIDMDAIPTSPRVVTSLDTSPDLDDTDGYDDNRIVIVTSHHHDNIYVLDADETDSTYPVQLLTTLTDVNGVKEIPCAAIDADNDIWAIVFMASDEYELHHWSYIVDDNTGGPYYTYESGDVLNLTTELGADYDVYDMVVGFVTNHLYILEAGTAGNGRIQDVDLNPSPPVHHQSQAGIFTSSINEQIWRYQDWGTDTNMHSLAYGCDIMIDHDGADSCGPEHCRLTVIGSLGSGLTVSSEVVRLDLDLNVMERRQSTEPFFILCAGLSTDANESDRAILSLPKSIFPLDFITEFKFFLWNSPGDW